MAGLNAFVAMATLSFKITVPFSICLLRLPASIEIQLSGYVRCRKNSRTCRLEGMGLVHIGSLRRPSQLAFRR